MPDPYQFPEDRGRFAVRAAAGLIYLFAIGFFFWWLSGALVGEDCFLEGVCSLSDRWTQAVLFGCWIGSSLGSVHLARSGRLPGG
jgi:hypothetical protein